jgi:hypothetical protein
LGSSVGREGAEHALARRPVDPDHADPGGATNGTFGMSLKRGLGELLEDRRGERPPWA